MPCLLKISQTVEGATATPSPASSPAIRRYPQCSLSAAMRSTRRTTRRWVGGRPGLFGLDLAAQRRRTISLCQRRILPGVMNECSAPWRERGMSVSSAANSARSVHVSLGRAAVCRCRTASWWRSRRISASFHAGGRLDSAAMRVSGRREGTRSAGTRDAIIDDRDALLQVGSTLMTCLYGVFGNHNSGRMCTCAVPIVYLA